MSLPLWSLDQVIAQLTSNLNWTNLDRSYPSTIKYSFATTSDEMAEIPLENPGNKFFFQPFNSTQSDAARLAFSLWSDLIQVNVAESEPAAANITLGLTIPNTDVLYAATTNIAPWKAPISIWLTNAHSSDANQSLTVPLIGRYGFQTYVHEIGHSLGLAHMGSYNGNSNPLIPSSIQDSTTLSIMSYFGPNMDVQNAEAESADWIPEGESTAVSPQTPMLNDVSAIQHLYGVSAITRTDNTIYGFNSSIIGQQRSIYDFSVNRNPILTIFDSSGDDTLDLSGWSSNSLVDLTPGTYSSANAMTNNIGIARGVFIENANTGSGDDYIVGNSLSNTLNGAGGADTIEGKGGNDRLVVTSGADKLYGGQGDDTYELAVITSAFHDPYEVFEEGSGTDVIEVQGLEITGAQSPTIERLTFKIKDGDLWMRIPASNGLDVDFGNSNFFVVRGWQADGAKVEALKLLASEGFRLGPTLDLNSVWSATSAFGDSSYHRLTLAGTDGQFGANVVPLLANPAPEATFQRGSQYNLPAFADLAGLSVAAYERGSALSSAVASLGWTLVGELNAPTSISFGVGITNAHVFAAQRLINGKKELAISFEGTAGSIDIVTDVSTWGFTHYYKAVRSAVQSWLNEAAAHKDDYSNIYITGHSLGGAAAQIALLDIVAADGADVWPIPPLDSTDRIALTDRNWVKSVVSGATFGAPSISIDAPSLIPGLEQLFLSVPDSDLTYIKERLFQFEHKTEWLDDPVATLGSSNTARGDELGTLVVIGLRQDVAARYDEFVGSAADLFGFDLHASAGYRESLLRALTGSPLIGITAQGNFAGLEPVIPTQAAGTDSNDTLIDGSYQTGGAGNDILIAEHSAQLQMNGGTGEDTYIIRGFNQNITISGPQGEIADHLILGVRGVVTGAVNEDTDNLVITLRKAGTLEQSTVTVSGWYSSPSAYKFANIERLLPNEYAYWTTSQVGSRELGAPLYGIGTSDSDVIYGSVINADLLVGDLGNDTITARGGDDTIFGDLQVTSGMATDGGIDNISGGDGNDTIYGGGSWDLLNGDAGSDRIYGDDGDDQLDSGADNEQDFLYGNAGNDRLVSRGTGDMLSGGAGNDTYSFEATDGGAENTLNDSGSGSDLLRVLAPGADYAQTRFYVTGTALQIRIFNTESGFLRGLTILNMADASGRIEKLEVDQGDAGAQSMGSFDLNVAWDAALAGDATGGRAFLGSTQGGIYTGDGDDVIYGTSDADWLDGRLGNDAIYGREGDDRLWGGQGDDTIVAGAGNDQVNTGQGNDRIAITVDGNDNVTGGLGSDALIIDASTFSYTYQYGWSGWAHWYTAGSAQNWWGGKDAAGNAVVTVDVNSSYATIEQYVNTAVTNEMRMYAYLQWGLVEVASLTFDGIERLDVTMSGSLANDLLFVRGTGNYDGTGGNDAIYADLSNETGDVVFDAASDQTYHYAGSTFTNFERFLLTTGSGNDRIDSSAFTMDDYLILGAGDNVALTGGGNDYVRTAGAGANWIDAAEGNDTVLSGDGSDRVYAGSGSDKVSTMGGDDLISITVDGYDQVSGGLGVDRLIVDASAFNYSGFGRNQWEGKDADGHSVVSAHVNSSYETITQYLNTAVSNEMRIYADYSWGSYLVASLTFDGIEGLDVTMSAAVGGNDLLFVRGTGNYDGKGGNDAIYADLSSETGDVVFDATNDQTYHYAGSTFTNFERFLLTTGSGNDRIDSTAVVMDDYLVLGEGANVALTGGGNDYISTGNGGSAIDAGSGNDRLISGSGNDVLRAGAGNDNVIAGAGDDDISITVDGTDTVSAGEGSDRLSIDASTFNYGGYGHIWWEGKDAQGSAVIGVDVNSSSENIRTYARTAVTNQLNVYVDVYHARVATLTFTGVENLDVTGSAAVNDNDLIFARGTGNYNGNGGNDAIVADLSSETGNVVFDAASDQSYSYAGSTFKDFERFLLTTGTGADVIDSTAVALDDYLVLGAGNDIAKVGNGSDFVDAGAGSDVVEGGAGNDALTGGEGSDTFVYALSGNGNDRIQDLAQDDVIHVVGASLSGSVVAGTGTVGNGQVQVSSAGGVTTLYIGTDATVGADVTIQLTGTFVASAVHASGETITVDIPNTAPVGPATMALPSGLEDVPYEFDASLLLTGFSDANADGLRVINLTASGGTLQSTPTGWKLTTPANASPTVTLNYSVTDDHGGTVTASRTIAFAPVNDAPVVAAVLAPASASAGIAFNYVVPPGTFTDVENATLSYSATLADAGALPAWLSFDAATRTFSGTPAAADAASLSLLVTASDGQLRTSTPLALTVQGPANRAPTGPATGSLAPGMEDMPHVITASALLQGISDADGDPLAVQDLSASHGTLAQQPDGSWQLTPAADFYGTVTLNYAVADGRGGSMAVARTIDVAPVNDAPVATGALAPASATAGQALSYAVPQGTFTDVDSVVLSYSATLTDGSPLPAWLAFDAATRSFGGTPTEAGTLAIAVRASDGSLSAQTTWNLVVSAAANRPPTGPATGALPDGVEDIAYRFTEDQLLQGWTDPDGDALHLPSALGLPIGNELIHNPDGSWTVIPAANFSGPINLHYFVSDGRGEVVSSLRTVTFAPVNDAPVGSALDTVEATAGAAFSYTVPATTFTDAEGDTLALWARQADGAPLPAWLAFDPTTRVFSGRPAAATTLNLVITASDGQGSGNATLTLAVQPAAANRPPAGATTGSLPAGTEDVPYSLTSAQLLSGLSDPDGDTLRVSDLSASTGNLSSTGADAWQLLGPSNFNGTVTLAYLVVDDRGASVSLTRTLNLLPVNDAPAGALAGSLPGGVEDAAYTLTTGALTQGITDADGGPLIISNLSADHGSLQTVGDHWVLTPQANFASTVVLDFTLDDGHGGVVQASRSLALTPVDDQAVITGQSVHVAETNAPITVGGTLALTDVDGLPAFIAQPATGGNFGVFQLDAAGHWSYAARMAYDYLSPGQSLTDTFQVRTTDGAVADVSVIIDGTSDDRFVVLGNAPVRQTGAGGQWEQAWTQAGFAITHKADYTNAAESWSPVKLTSVGSQTLSGGDIYSGDLGVSGQSINSSSIRQEVDGREAIQVALPNAAKSVTLKVSNFYINDDGTLYAEAGLLRFIDAVGHVVGEKAFTASSATGLAQVSLDSTVGFTSIEILSGASAAGQFEHGAYAYADGSFGHEAYQGTTSNLHGSEFLIDELDFVFEQLPQLIGVAPTFGASDYGLG